MSSSRNPSFEVRAATNFPGDLTFAIRLTEPRARLWETNITAVAEAIAGAKPEVSNLQSQISNPQPAVQSTNEPPAATPVLRSSATAEGGQHASRITYHVSRFTFHSPRVTRSLEISRAGEWTVLGVGHGTNVLTADLLDRVRQGGLASDPHLEALWLHADFDLGRLASALMLDMNLPADLPRMTVDVTGDGKNVRTRGQFNFPKPLPADLPEWNIPTNIIHDPLCSFTAIRGLAPWLASFKGWTDLQIGPPPDQLYVWAQSGLPFLTYCAAPLPDTSNVVYQLTEHLLQKANPELATNGMGHFARATNFNGVLWKELPIMDPSLRYEPTPGGDFAYLSMTVNPMTNRPAPPALFYQVLGATNMVAYDWELTGLRAQQLLFTGQFLRLVTHHAQVPPKSASVAWLMALENNLGNCVTALTRTGPAQISLTRRSTLGLTALELHLLTDWFESPQFPRGLHTFAATPEPLPAQRQAARHAARASSNTFLHPSHSADGALWHEQVNPVTSVSSALHTSFFSRWVGGGLWSTVLRRRGWLIVALTVLFALTVRVRLRDMPLERDEGEYAYAGQIILHGLAPYKAAYTMKLPGTYAAYALSMVLFGQTPAGIHFGLALVNGASIVLMFLLGRMLLDEAAGVAAAVAFALLSLSPSILGLAAHATHYVVLAALAGILSLLRAEARRQDEQREMAQREAGLEEEKPLAAATLTSILMLFFVSGLCFGLAFLMKQHGIFFGLCGMLYLLWTRLGQGIIGSSRRDRFKREIRSPSRRQAQNLGLLRDAGVFALGGLIPYGVTCLILLWAGAFPSFVFWTITYAAKYASATPLVNGPDVLRVAVKAVIGPNMLLWILPCVGAWVLWIEERLETVAKSSRDRNLISAREGVEISCPRFFVTALLFCSLASVSVGLSLPPALFHPPPASTGAADRNCRQSRSPCPAAPHHGRNVPRPGYPRIVWNRLGQRSHRQRLGLVWYGNRRRRTDVYGSTLFTEATRAANFIRTNSPPDARIAVVGSEPEIYFYARRRAATGYLYMYPLMEKQPFALKMQQQMMQEIERARPEFVVYVDDEYSWLKRPDSRRNIFDWWKDYWGKNLDLAQSFTVEENLGRGADFSDPMRRPSNSGQTQGNILILQRRH